MSYVKENIKFHAIAVTPKKGIVKAESIFPTWPEAETAAETMRKLYKKAVVYTFETYTAKYANRKDLETAAFKKALSDMEIVMFNTESEIMNEIRKLSDSDLLDYLDEMIAER